MAKYSFEFKKKVVLDYFNGESGARFLAEKYSISSDSSVKQWIRNYKSFGDTELMRFRKKNSFEYKLMVVELYLLLELSICDFVIQEKINNRSLITKWVNDFRIAGPDALRSKKKGFMMAQKLYLDPFTDLSNREIRSYGVSPTPSAKNIMDTLNTAIEMTSDCPYTLEWFILIKVVGIR